MTDTDQGSPAADSVAALTAQVAALAAAVDRIGGYAAQEEWAWVECDGEGIWAPLAPRAGADPLRIECRSDLLIGEVEAIPIEPGTPMRDVWRAIAPHVRAWNVRAVDATTGEWADVPPPRMMGPDAFRYVKPLAAEWMAFVVKFARLRDAAHPKDARPTAGTPSRPSGSDSASSPPAKASRRSPKGTT